MFISSIGKARRFLLANLFQTKRSLCGAHVAPRSHSRESSQRAYRKRVNIRAEGLRLILGIVFANPPHDFLPIRTLIFCCFRHARARVTPAPPGDADLADAREGRSLAIWRHDERFPRPRAYLSAWAGTSCGQTPYGRAVPGEAPDGTTESEWLIEVGPITLVHLDRALQL